MKSGLQLIAVSLAMLAGVGGAAAAGASPKRHCALTATDQTPGAAKGYDLGFVRCSGPYGKGITVITYRSVIALPTATDTGTFKDYFDRGTIRGTYQLTATPQPSGPITAKGPIRVTGGTGAFAGTRGKGQMVCVTNDGGAHYSCVAVF